MSVQKVSVSVSLPVEILRTIDQRRGYTSRSAYITEVLQRDIARDNKKNALDGFVKRADL